MECTGETNLQTPSKHDSPHPRSLSGTSWGNVLNVPSHSDLQTAIHPNFSAFLMKILSAPSYSKRGSAKKERKKEGKEGRKKGRKEEGKDKTKKP